MTTPNHTGSPKRTPGASSDDPLLQFLPQGAAPDQAPPAAVPAPVKLVDTREQPSPARHAQPVPAAKAAVHAVHRVAPRSSSRWPPWVLTFLGGALAGALVMRLFSAEPAPMVATQAQAPASAPRSAAEIATPIAVAATSAPATAPAAAAVTPSAETAARRATIPVVPDGGVVAASAADRAVPAPVAPPLAAPGRSAAIARLSGYRGSIAVESEPPGARVFVNGVSVGSTPMVLKDVPIGSRAVRLEAAGYQRWSSAISVAANRQTRVTAKLSRVN